MRKTHPFLYINLSRFVFVIKYIDRIKKGRVTEHGLGYCIKFGGVYDKSGRVHGKARIPWSVYRIDW